MKDLYRLEIGYNKLVKTNGLQHCLVVKNKISNEITDELWLDIEIDDNGKIIKGNVIFPIEE